MNLTFVTAHEFKTLIHTESIFYGYCAITRTDSILLICATDKEIIETAVVSSQETTRAQKLLTHYPNIQHNQKIIDALLQHNKPTLLVAGTPFQISVWQAALFIKPGTTCSYQQLAQNLGKPKAYRAVARALGQNKIAYFIPCHRIIGKDATLTGYKWGVDHKKALISYENNFSTTE